MLSAQEIKELEKKWLRFKIKEHSKKALLSSLILSFTILGGYIYINKENLSFFKKEDLKKEIKKEILIADKRIENLKKPKKKEEVLTLNTDFIKNIKNKSKKTSFKNPPLPPPKIKPSIKIKEAANSPKEENKKIKIISKKVDTITFLKKKFQATHNINYALMLSNTYFEKRKYKKALYWAIKANEIDPTNERSWILFAKAKTKMGQKKEAIKALKIYLQNRASQRVLNALQKLEKNSNFNG